MALKAKANCCEEASPLSKATYIPCNQPATRMIGWPARQEGPYRMCESCADHCVHQRGATDQGPFTPTDPAADASGSVTPAASAAGVPDFLAKKVKDSPKPPPSEDSLKRLREKAAKVRDDMLEATDLEEKLKAVNDRITKAKAEELPALMDELGVQRLDLAPEGNFPGYTATARPFYRANIAASWPPEKKAKAYTALTAAGSGDLLKTTVEIVFARGQKDDAKRALALLRENGFTPEVEQAVPHTTLTAWLKEQVEASIPVDLETFGAQIGRVVDLKPLKEK